MSNKYRRRLEEVMALLPCPVSGCWGLHGTETSSLRRTFRTTLRPLNGVGLAGPKVDPPLIPNDLRNHAEARPTIGPLDRRRPPGHVGAKVLRVRVIPTRPRSRRSA